MIRCKGIKSSFIVLIATILLIAQSSIYTIPTVLAETLTNGVTITAIDEEGEYVVETEAVSFDEGDTALDVLEEAADVDYEETDHGQLIAGINDLKPEAGYYWGFFVNGSSADVGADGYGLTHGDNLLFKVVDEDIRPHATIDVKVSAVGLDDEEVLPETNVDIVEFATAYDALVQATNKTGIDLDVTVDSAWLTFINDLDDRLDDSAYWGMYLNKDYMETGLVGQQMQEGYHLELIAERLDDGEPEEEQNNDEDATEEQESNGDNEDDQGSNGQTEEEPTKDFLIDDSESENLQEVTSASIEKSADYLITTDNLGWYGFIALNALDKEVSQEIAKNSVDSVVSNEGDFRNVTDTARNILILTAAGKDATDIEGYNLIEKLTNHERMESQGNNGPIYSLLALNSGNYEVADDAIWTRDRLIERLFDEQLNNGGWALFGTATSVDLTGMALAALAPHQENEDVKDAIDQAVNYLSNRFVEEGGYPDQWHGGDSSPSVAMALIGMASVGMDPAGAELTTEEGVHLVEHLLKFQKEDGGFSQNLDGSSNGPASNQGLLGLAAYDKYVNNDGTVFDFSVAEEEDKPENDGEKADEEEKPEEEKLSGKTEKIINPTITINEEKNEMFTRIGADDISGITENEVIIQSENAPEQLVFDVEISNEALNILVDTNSDLTIDKGDVNLHIPNLVLQQILKEAGDHPVNIKLVKYEASHALGPVYDFTITSGGKSITEFNGNKITLTFQVDQELAANVDPDSIKVFYFNEETSGWEVLENSVYDPETGLATAKTTHFSIFGVFELGTTTDVEPTVTEPVSTVVEDETDENGETTDRPSDDNSKEQSEAEAATDKAGSKLPDTATNLFNLMLIGAVLFLTGVIIFIVKRRMEVHS
ncbi:DUF4430 domain-containing protein [Virgibacillus kimchii]